MLDAINSMQWSMDKSQLQLQIITQNISNIHTPGYKKRYVNTLDFNEHLPINTSALLQQTQVNSLLTPGTLNKTNNHNHLALTEDAFFQVQTEKGIAYTKRGDFHLDAHGKLRTSSGAALLGSEGELHIEDSNFQIDLQGNLWVDKNKVDKISTVHFEHPENLEYLGDGLFASEETPKSVYSKVMQGYLEESNVKTLEEMTDMMQTARHFESAQRILRTADSMLSTAISHLGENNV